MSRISFDVVDLSGKTRDAIPTRIFAGETWISNPNCNYPQVVILRLAQPTHLKSIEILIHRRFIPSKMDLYVSNVRSTAIPPLHQFVLLGDIKFRNKKEDTGRHELKTIFLDTNATFVRFAFGRNYQNLSNPRGQIGVVEINLYGDAGTTAFNRTSSSISIYNPRAVGALASRNSNLSTTKSSLSSTSIWRMASRGSTRSTNRSSSSNSKSAATAELRAALQRAIETKSKAANDENYALAKAAQRAQVQLELVLKQIRDAERAKRRAVDEDDFDRAQSLSDQIATLRDNALQQVDSRFFNSGVPNDPRPTTTQTVKTTTSVNTNGTTASSVLRRFQDGRLRIDSPPPLNAQLPSAFQPIPLTPSDVGVYPRTNQLTPSIHEGSLPPQSKGSGSVSLNASDSASKRSISPASIAPPSISSRNSTIRLQQPSPIAPLNGDLRLPILPDSRLPNVRRLSDPTVYKTDRLDETSKNSTSSSLASRLSAIFNRPAKPQSPARQVSPVRNRFLEKENQIVPGARRKKSPSVNENGEEVMNLEGLLEGLPAGDRPLVTLAADNFGLEPVAHVYSKSWKERRHGYSKIKEFLTTTNVSKEKARDVVKAVEPLIVRGLSEKIFNVYSSVLELLRQLLDHFIIVHGLVESDGPRIVNATYDLLISRTGDTVERRFSSSTFSSVAGLLQGDTRIANAYMSKFMLPFDAHHSVRCDRGKAKIVVDGVEALYSLRLPALTVKKICQFALECLNHTDAKVRDYGQKLVLSIYERGDRDEVRMSLPRRTGAVKNGALRNLLNDLDAIDGRNGLSTKQNLNTRFESDGLRNQTASSTRSPARSRDRVRSEKPNVRLLTDKNDEDSNDPIDYSKVCMYCGKLGPDLNLSGLDQHYNKDCPMLTRCPSCSEVVETRFLSEHQLYDCKKKQDFKQCDRCQQAVLTNLYNTHRSSKKCRILPTDGSIGRCPLCSEDIQPNNDIGWRKHLNECTANPRIKSRRKTIGGKRASR
ncbi:UVR domain-containing protein [Aphelenchoides besseyi]|nr:UVR domain-containing protein [Aphelenchoides besseyi]